MDTPALLSRQSEGSFFKPSMTYRQGACLAICSGSGDQGESVPTSGLVQQQRLFQALLRRHLAAQEDV
jgi:hypothetical protein